MGPSLFLLHACYIITKNELTAVSEYIASAIIIVLLEAKLLLVSTQNVDSMLGEFTLSGKKAEGLNLYSPDGYKIQKKSLVHLCMDRKICMLYLYKCCVTVRNPLILQYFEHMPYTLTKTLIILAADYSDILVQNECFMILKL